MVDITFKTFTLRKAIAAATIKTSAISTVEAVKNGTVPKGNVLEFARASALLAIKKTSDVIPDCHPLPVEFAAINYEMSGLDINITVEVHTIYKTGVEVEAMHGASVAALVIYDMLKPIDKNVEISNIRLLEKQGGKSSQKNIETQNLTAAVVVCSDSVSQGIKNDTSGKLLVESLSNQGISNVDYSVVPDDVSAIQEKIESYKSKGCNLLVFTGGTGLSDRDVTPEAVLPFITKEIPGIMETARNYGQDRVKTSMLSRGIAGFSDDMLILTFPGSSGAVKEYVQALFPQVLHVFSVKKGDGH
ncbi:bifunctional molybdenum cofactor biosynthesis protein MoaC/MoaB [Chryseobacterium shandongense]|uniref:Molybdopterin adenylyltransferase n=1 Tax=Chryseobacterium shandongense TaxID=1493872 RepID=A0AAD0YI38_9FLAO|nr:MULTISPECIES: bifunctional molybdenum cofactor biosynthesis protein MoaC/MoaB [Chryseobacterium]AZA88824.1 bifunctional molybdenum cofactor biosynthesis protein MoaC/MoaB [Chryseobacterium shandongense]AZA97368.1 bifunctional molybdenum cofactor biosynthesis protein MoaC/MoaB [Chryseobacterium shandongense]